MRMLGLVSLLVALAIVGGVAVSRQLQAVGPRAVVCGVAHAARAAAANVREASQQLQEQVRRDVTKALEQGARHGEGARAVTAVVTPGDASAMRIALDQGEQRLAVVGVVPVGAVIVHAGQVVATGCNRPILRDDPTAHAEIVALRRAAQLLGNYRLPECEVYVTLEPCAMCAMALMHARIRRVVFGAVDPKTGAAGSVVDLFADARLNHHTEVQGGVLADECDRVLRDFLAERRELGRRRRAARRQRRRCRGDPRRRRRRDLTPNCRRADDDPPLAEHRPLHAGRHRHARHTVAPPPPSASARSATTSPSTKRRWRSTSASAAMTTRAWPRLPCVARAAPSIAMASRGGYGLTRLLERDRLHETRSARSVEGAARWVGHSDVTALQLGMLAHTGSPSWAGPLACFDFGGDTVDDVTEGCFVEAMSGELEAVGFRTDAGHDGLQSRGTLWGGNLAVLMSLLGTPHWPEVKGGVLFVEDVNEHPYRIERMLLQLHQAGVCAPEGRAAGRLPGHPKSPLDPRLHAEVGARTPARRDQDAAAHRSAVRPRRDQGDAARRRGLRFIVQGRDALLGWLLLVTLARSFPLRSSVVSIVSRRVVCAIALLACVPSAVAQIAAEPVANPYGLEALWEAAS